MKTAKKISRYNTIFFVEKASQILLEDFTLTTVVKKKVQLVLEKVMALDKRQMTNYQVKYNTVGKK